jgi:hypothetical protein
MNYELGRVKANGEWETQMVNVIRVQEDGRKIGDIYTEEGKKIVVKDADAYYWKIVEI